MSQKPYVVSGALALRCAIATIACLSALTFATGTQGAAAQTAAPSPAAASAQPNPEELPSLAEILTAAEARDSIVHNIERRLQAAAKEVDDVLDNPPPWAWFTGFGDSALNLRLHAWVDDYDRGTAAQSALRVAILKQLNQAGIDLPSPQHDITIRSAPGWPLGPPQVEKNEKRQS